MTTNNKPEQTDIANLAMLANFVYGTVGSPNASPVGWTIIQTSLPNNGIVSLTAMKAGRRPRV